MLLVIAYIWRPNENNSRYPFLLSFIFFSSFLLLTSSTTLKCLLLISLIDLTFAYTELVSDEADAQEVYEEEMQDMDSDADFGTEDDTDKVQEDFKEGDQQQQYQKKEPETP